LALSGLCPWDRYLTGKEDKVCFPRGHHSIKKNCDDSARTVSCEFLEKRRMIKQELGRKGKKVTVRQALGG